MKNINNEELVGKAFEELSFEEMALDQGSAGDVEARTSPLCLTASAVASGAISWVSSKILC
ncbi:lichenicidin A2 family type 2 lantibiotic [Paraclostridium sordellii]|uniref:lichenicidin A2 family type 2 lantibiotic n=1 Tax=Paraclostridium sordellii TaxID=1505 RepID=UPI001C6127DB|nr:lichenicidin A2 family type 2 lantibiotic [Paeniclostridium sordellii]QYE99797.1 lichenicidin A2 family type 2 lantibiotic [Paeniclostridium sordellii]QYE99798.1 lichenicidin A2 family type 2 lantibiotic [Paeniclostridium sordellii]